MPLRVVPSIGWVDIWGLDVRRKLFKFEAIISTMHSTYDMGRKS